MGRNVTAVVAAVLSVGLPLFAKDYSADRYDVILHLDQQGFLSVTETVVYRFEGGPFQQVFRNIETKQTDGVVDVQALMDGKPCPPGTGPGQVEIQGTSPVSVRWHFGPLSDETHRFALRYRVMGAVRKVAGGDALVWHALPQKRSYRISSSTITVEYPPGTEPTAVRLENHAEPFVMGPERAAARLSELAPNSALVVRAEFPSGSFAGPAAQWQSVERERRNTFLRGMGQAALGAGVGVALLVYLGLRYRGSNPSSAYPAAGMVLTEPPGALSPVAAAVLIGTVRPGAGLLLDLVRRGVLRVEEDQPGLLRTRNFRLVLANPAGVGTQYEREFLEVAFPSGDNQASLNHAMSRLMTKWRFIVRSVRQELVQAGLVDPDRQRRRTVLLSAGGIAIAVATLPLFLGATAKSEPLLGGMLITSGIAAMLLGAGLFALGASLRPWTATGAAAAAQWQAFVRYLRSLAKGRTPMPASDVIEKLWPYAAAFGIGRTLVSQATATSGFIAPPWFAAFAGQQADGGDSFAAFIVSSDMNASTGDSGGGVSDGGGGGASGGGDSGAS